MLTARRSNTLNHCVRYSIGLPASIRARLAHSSQVLNLKLFRSMTKSVTIYRLHVVTRFTTRITHMRAEISSLLELLILIRPLALLTLR